MTHEEAAFLVPDLGRGRLTPEEEAMVQTHLANCTECAGLTEAYKLIASALRDASSHPVPAELVAHAMGTTSRTDLEDHFAQCPPCAEQAAAIRTAESALGGRRVSLRTWTAWTATAALPLLLGYFGWMHAKVLPDMRRALARAQESGTVTPETVALPLLAPATRGGGEPTTVRVRAGQQSIALAVAPTLPRDLADAEVLRIEVRQSGGGVAFSREMTAGEMRRLTGSSGAFALVLPTSALPSGEAWLHIHANSRGELLSAPFQVRRE